jgi:lipopolysaccharide export system permease protein
MPVFIGAWLSSAVLFPLGIFLTYKAATDSALLNTDSYASAIKNFFKKISSFFNFERGKNENAEK